MKQSFWLLLPSLALGVVACNTAPCNCDDLKKLPIDQAPQRSEQQSAAQTNLKIALANQLKSDLSKIPQLNRFKAQSLNAGDLKPLFVSKQIEAQVSEDAALVNSVFAAVFSAENRQNPLKVEILLSEQPIDNGVYVFSLQTEEDQKLQIQLYDEEGFEMVANNEIAITKGNNYKALNVSQLDAGNYIFKLKNPETQAETMRRLNLNK